MIQRGGVPDFPRAADWFVRWWRDKGGATSNRRNGWGLDFEWSADADVDADANASDMAVQAHMERCIARFVSEESREEEQGGGVSTTQERKRNREESRAKRALLVKARRRRRT